MKTNLAISLLFEMAEYPAVTQCLIKLLKCKIAINHAGIWTEELIRLSTVNLPCVLNRSKAQSDVKISSAYHILHVQCLIRTAS